MATSLVQQAQLSVLPVHHKPGSQVQTTAAIHYRPLRPEDFAELKAAHAALFPIDYEDSFFHRATNGLDRIWSCAAINTEPYGDGHLVGFIIAKTVFLHEVDASDRQHMGLLSAVLDHDRVLYIMTLGVVEGHRNRGVASTLISIASQHAYEARCRAVFLHVITYNTAAMSLYMRQGFSCMAKLAAFYWIATGRTPIPDQQLYDAYLFVQYVGGAAGLPSPWDLVSLAWSPLRVAFNRIHACMPGFCRPEDQQQQPQPQQQPQHQQQQQPFMSGASGAQSWNEGDCGSFDEQLQQHSHHMDPGAQQQQQPAQQQWHSDARWQPRSRQRLPRGPSLPGRQQHQQLEQEHSVVQLHPVQEQDCWQQHFHPRALPQQQQQHQHQQYLLHQAMQPPPQRMLRWLFNGASRGSSGAQEQGHAQQQHLHQLQHTSLPIRQQWHSDAGEPQHQQG